jgi:hypothetical protein
MQHSRHPATVPEKHKIPGLCYAFSEGGLELPVIDLAHPAFATEASAERLKRLGAETASSLGSLGKLPPFMQAAFARRMARSSILAREMRASHGGFMSGMGSYLCKLGPGALGSGYASEIDRKLSLSLPCLNTRLRLKETARLLAEGFAGPLGREPGKPLALFNIAVGPAADSLNALMEIRRSRPDLLEGRQVRVYVLDGDISGPAFAAASLKALLAEGGPLHGLEASLIRVAYDWNEAATLGALVEAETGSVIAASSEGGLLEYGSDEAIAANLRALAPARGASFVASASRVEGGAGALNRMESGSVRIRLRPASELGSLASASGWSVAETAECPLSTVLRLYKNN